MARLVHEEKLFFGKADVRVWVAGPEFAAELKPLIQAWRGEDPDTNVLVSRVIVRNEVILPPDGDGCPVAICVLFWLVHFVGGKRSCGARFDSLVGDVLSDLPAGKVFRIFRVPMWMGVLSERARWLCAFIDRSRQNLKITFPVITHGMACQG